MTLDPVSLTPVSSAGFSAEEPTQKTLLPDDEIPHLGHAILFFVMCVPLLFAGEGVFLFLAKQVPQLHSKSYRELFSLMSQDARLAIPTQAFVYLLIGFVTMVVFTVLWQRPFFEGIHWNASTGFGGFAGWVWGWESASHFCRRICRFLCRRIRQSCRTWSTRHWVPG
jgi:hypothetical protein